MKKFFLKELHSNMHVKVMQFQLERISQRKIHFYVAKIHHYEIKSMKKFQNWFFLCRKTIWIYENFIQLFISFFSSVFHGLSLCPSFLPAYLSLSLPLKTEDCCEIFQSPPKKASPREDKTWNCNQFSLHGHGQ